MNDPVLGEIAYTEPGGWEGSYTYPFLGREVTVRLALGGWDENDPVEPLQREAVRRFTEHKDELCAQADDAIYANYLERRPELREQFGDSADKLMPIINDKSGLAQLVRPTAFFVAYPLRGSEDRVIGLLSNCTWEPELGLAVKIVNEKIVEVGPQDIVL
ncbi:Uncharacterised protein [Mycobacteroides abscessus subsp. abscessus]|uniref:DUF6985 domain-containing protein n=1 Tax=Mycobacteroides abscessus TaxID=36809 RepID=UPI000929090A|nr:hypothetical protein [Mycobacteroides abscessus]SIE28333.1 Uncharacterised protein [Mycobacteroides abscessus subsp. abscessus]SKV14553.1 Uncharacterised protein [Mycobacteroides abscessus subsp. abscessus]